MRVAAAAPHGCAPAPHHAAPLRSPYAAPHITTVGPPGSPGPKKLIFSKLVPRPLGMLKQVFSGRFEPMVARFGPWKIPKCLENGPFWDQQWVKNGSKTCFHKNHPGPFMMLKQVVLAHFEPVATSFGSWKIPKCLESGPFCDQKSFKNGSKKCFSKTHPGPPGMLKQVFVARFDPVLTECSPFNTCQDLQGSCGSALCYNLKVWGVSVAQCDYAWPQLPSYGVLGPPSGCCGYVWQIIEFLSSRVFSMYRDHIPPEPGSEVCTGIDRLLPVGPCHSPGPCWAAGRW